MKRKHIDASREVRLWIGQVIVPACTFAVVALSNDKVRTYAAEKITKIKSKFQKKIIFNRGLSLTWSPISFA